MTHRATPPVRTTARGARLTAAALATGFLTLAAPAVAHAETGTDSSAPVCTGAEVLPGISNDGQKLTDNSIAVFVGGDYVALEAAAESEGRLVVGGTTLIEAGQFNVGRAGGGSQITPPGGSDVVVSRGAVTVDAGSVLDVNHGVVGGGNVLSGGSIAGTVRYNDGVAKPDDAPGAEAVVSPTSATLGSTSTTLAALTPNGTLDTTGAWPRLVGDGGSGTQVFSLTAAQVAGLDAVTFAEVGTSAPIVINVSGTTATLDTIHTAAGTLADRVDTWAELGAWAPRIVWNFTDATDLTLSGGSQLVGSILAPAADVTDTTNTNGRLWIGGDLEFGATGSGLEHHNYPWIGAPELGCEPMDVPEPNVPETPLPELPTLPPTAPSATPTESTPESTPGTPADDVTTPPADDVTDSPSEPTEVLGTTEPSPEVSTDATITPEVLAATEPSPEAQEPEGGLAMTGATVAGASVLALALLGGGATLLLLRRRAAQG